MDDSKPFNNSILVTLAAIVIVIAGLKVAAPLLAQFLMALFIAVVCLPSVRWLERHKVPQPIAILIVLSAILAFVYLVVALVGDSVNSFNEQKEFYMSQLYNQMQSTTDWLIGLGVPAENIDLKALIAKLDIMALITRVLGGVGVIFGDFFVIFLSVIFILAEASSFPAKFAKAFSNSQDKMVHVNHVLGKIRHYLAIKTASSLFTGALVSIALFAIGVDYPFLWGMLAFLLNYIPNIGSIIAAIPALMLALVQLGPVAVLWTATISAYQQSNG